MIEWAEPREPLASWAEVPDLSLPPAGTVEPADACTWVPTRDNRSLFISSATGGWILCDPTGRSEVQNRWGRIGDPRVDPLIEVLWRRGVATIGGVGAFDEIDVGAAIEASRQRYTIVLLLSTGCNLACSYCYLGHRQPTPDVSMPLETAFAAVDAALRQPWDEVMFDFGEIAVSGDRFEAVARHARDRAAELGKRMRVAVQTNATTINAATVDVLADLNAVVGISLDGPEPLHDAGRTFRSGAGSYTRVLRALRLLDERSVPVHLIATIGRHNVDHPVDVVEELASHDPTSFLLKPVLAEGEAAGAWDHQGVRPDEYARFMVTVLRHAAQHGPRFLDQTATKFMARILGDYNGWRDSCTSRSCGSGRSLHVVDPSGRTHSCPRFVEEATDPGPITVTLG
ncbi:MAG: radical SAM protein, partial [Ilumatobacteraceae bacterium]